MSDEIQGVDTAINTSGEAPTETQNDVSRETPVTDATQQAEEPQTAEEWWYAEGIKGQGEKPEFFNSKKYKTLTDQAKAQRELEKKLGGFTGAPDEYEVRVADTYIEKGFELDPDDPFVEGFKEFAKEKQMNQEIFNDSINFYAELKLAEKQALREYVDAQRKELGSNGQRRLDDLQNWAGSVLPQDLVDGFSDMFPTAKSVEIMEVIAGMLLEKGVNPTSGEGATAYSEADVQKMQFELDQYGNRRINSDPEFRRKYEEISRKVRGTQEARRAIG